MTAVGGARPARTARSPEVGGGRNVGTARPAGVGDGGELASLTWPMPPRMT
jgi:hypothetical protein